MWDAAISGMKSLLGNKLTRETTRVACTEKLDNAPPGRYFIFELDSKVDRTTVTERVVLVSENAEWKVAGYFRRKHVSLGTR
jgi:hypothetical protein